MSRTMPAAILLLAWALSLGPVTAARADEVGLGIIAGEPTGISAKVRTAGNRALDLAMGWSLRKEGRLHVHSDVIFSAHEFATNSPNRADLYWGIGARLRLQESGDSRIGVRVPLGVSYEFGQQPVELFLEVGAVMDLLPETELDLGGGLGVRFRLGSR